MYLSTAGRWTTQDPTGLGPDSNPYRYVDNDPTDQMDPSGLDGVGHHWIPVSVLTDSALCHWLSWDAYHMGMGATSGPTEPGHLFGKYGGVTHAEYNKIIRQELSMLIKENGGRVISGEQMEAFINNIKSGMDRLGETNDKVKAFNAAIEAERAAYIAENPKLRGFRTEKNAAQWIKDGKSFLAGPGKGRIGPGGIAAIKGAMVISAVAGWVVYDTPQALATASESPHFKAAIKALNEGNLSQADHQLFGEGNARYSNCFYQELVDKGLEKYAVLFEEAYYTKLKAIEQDVRNPALRLPEDK